MSNELEKMFCTVRILDVPYHLDVPYDYYIPIPFKDVAKVGSFVSVPFGRGNRKTGAVITALKSKCDYNDPKPVFDVAAGEEMLDGDAMEMCRFLCDYTLCTYGEAVKTVVPTAALSRLNETFSTTGDEKNINKLSEKALIFYTFIKSRQPVTVSRLKSEFGDDTPSLCATLIRLGLAEREAKVKGTTNNRYLTYASVCDNANAEEALRKTRSELQREIILLLSKNKKMTAEELSIRLGRNVSPQLSSLVKKGIVALERVEIYRNPYLDKCEITARKDTKMSEEQQCAYNRIAALYDEGGPRAALLYGVTGSGKTRVIKEMIDKVIADGRGVILLVPEISLTPQTVGYFCCQYGERVAVIHSSLSHGERFDAWKRVKRGEADIVIGTRSAVFAPVKNLGMIVIDEEQEHTYKSDTDPKYLAHDVARFRSGKNNSLMLLSSATPSVSSYHKAVTGAYTLVEMRERYGNATLPEVVISDMRYETDSGNVSPVGAVLREKLVETFEKGKQSIVFLNRRGYNSAVSCRVCGEALKCPNCSVSLTYHTRSPLGDAENARDYFNIRAERGILACHYCGYRVKVPSICPSCGADHFRFVGCGTQKAEEELKKAVPGARILRMDMDTTKTKNSHEEILDKFRRGEADVLLGTQMVTKGHDFPNVTLVGVMNADSGLFLDDYRAAEKTFSMLTQVVGRAGRGRDAGVAVVQTSNPDSEVIRLAATQNYTDFFEKEIKLRRALVFPPFCDIAVVTMSCMDEGLLSSASVKLAERTKELLSESYKDVEAVVFGPFEAPVYKVQNTCRMRLVIKCRLNRRARQFVSQLICEFSKANKNLNVTADLNPSSL